MGKWFHRLRWILTTFFFAFFVWGVHWLDGLKFLLVTLTVCLIFGKTLCSFMCPMGYFQEIAFEARRILKIEGFARKEKFMEIINVTKYLLLLVL